MKILIAAIKIVEIWLILVKNIEMMPYDKRYAYFVLHS